MQFICYIFFTCNLFIIFIVAIENKSHLSKDTLTHFRGDLLKKLPLESETFMAKLGDAKLLPHSSGFNIQAMTTRLQKVAYFLEHVVSSGPDIYLPILIGIMEKEDDLVLISLARDMKNYMGTGNTLVSTYV